MTNGLTPVSSGGDPAEDLANLLRAFVSGGGSMETCVIVMSSQNAIGAHLTGHAAFERVGRQGGTVAGLPAVCSDTAGTNVLAIDVARVLVADDDEVGVGMSPRPRSSCATIRRTMSATAARPSTHSRFRCSNGQRGVPSRPIRQLGSACRFGGIYR